MSTKEATLSREELEELRSAIHGALEKKTNLASTLDMLGADDLIDEGGSALGILLEELGRVAAPSDVLDRAIRSALGLEAVGGPSIVYPLPAGVAPLHVEGRVARVNGLLAGEPTEELLLGDADGSVHVLQSGASGLVVDRISGLEPRAGWLRVSGDSEILDESPATDKSWTEVIPLIRSALAAQLVGASREMLHIAIDHVTTREQFGRAIGSFQAVRHRLAETYAAVAGAEAALTLSWAAAGGDDEADIAIVAKASAGRAFESAARNCVQVCGAMGLTFEHPLHFLVRFGTVRNVLFGSPSELSLEVGRRVIGGPTLARFDPLVDA